MGYPVWVDDQKCWFRSGLAWWLTPLSAINHYFPKTRPVLQPFLRRVLFIPM